MLETLQEMMVQDKDAQVVANCMSVLKQVCCPVALSSIVGIAHLKEGIGKPSRQLPPTIAAIKLRA